MLGAVGYGLVSLLTTGFSIARKTGRLAVLALIAAAVNIGLNFVLIPPFGIVGAAFATAIGYGVLARELLLGGAARVLDAVRVAEGADHARARHRPRCGRRPPLGSEAVAMPVKLLAIAAFLLGVRLSGAITGAELVELRRFVRGMIPIGARRSTL